MMLFRKYKLVNMLLTFDFSLAIVDELQRIASAYRGAPRVRLFFSEAELGVETLDVADGQLMEIVAEVKVVDSAEKIDEFKSSIQRPVSRNS